MNSISPSESPTATTGTSRRQALALALGSGIVASGLAPTPAQAAPAPVRAVRPEQISALADGLQLRSSPAWHLARRVCPAPTAAVVSQITKKGYDAWIEQQLSPGKIKDTRANELVSTYFSWATKTTKQVDKASHGQPWRAGKAMSVSRTVRQIYTERHLLESMVDTMGDHLYISAEGKADSFVAWFDWAVLRKYALGRYSDMLYAAITHPAMLIYLDNQLNSADNPNENLGRELLELHTVGVGNYTEADVRQSALLLTGHGLDWDKLVYHFEPWDHYVGPITVMGFSHPNASRSAGPDALRKYLGYLAHHPATAKHVCRRLAVRYVSDTPSDALVARLAAVYLANGTSLRAVMRALLHSDEFRSSVGQKWRRPQETLSTMIKAQKPGRIKPKGSQRGDLWDMLGTVQWLLYRGGHQPRMWPVVNGYPDQAGDWMATQDMLAHFDAAFARTSWTDKEIPVASWAKALGITTAMTPEQAAARVAYQLTGYSWDSDDLAVVAARLRGDHRGRTLTKQQITERLPLAVHLVFCSPYFMLR